MFDDPTFILGGGGDVGRVTGGDRCRASDRSSRQRFNNCEREITAYYQRDLGTTSNQVE